MSDALAIGTRVTYADEPADTPACIGTIRKPTADELAFAHAVYEDEGIGPDHGDVIVQWGTEDPWDRSWENPRDLQVLGQVTAMPSSRTPGAGEPTPGERGTTGTS